MGWFSKLKKKVKKINVKRVVRKVAKPVSRINVKRVVKKAVVKPIKKVVKPRTIVNFAKKSTSIVRKTAKTVKRNVSVKNVVKTVNAASKITYPLAKRVSSVAKKVGLPEVNTLLNVKKAITNPREYAVAATKVAGKAASLYDKIKSGKIANEAEKYLKGEAQNYLDKGKDYLEKKKDEYLKRGEDYLTKSANDLKKGVASATNLFLDKPKTAEPQRSQSTYSQLTGGDVQPLYPNAPSQRYFAPQQQNFSAPTTQFDANRQAKSKMPLIMAGVGVLGIFVIIIATRK